MQTLLKKIFVADKKHYFSVILEDNLKTAREVCSEFLGTDVQIKLARQANFSSTNTDEIWKFLRKQHKNGLYFVVETAPAGGSDAMEVHVTFEAAEAAAEKSADQVFARIIKADETLEAIWIKVSAIIASVIAHEPELSAALRELSELDDDLGEAVPGHHDNDASDLKQTVIDRNMDLLAIVNAIGWLEGKQKQEPIYSTDHSSEKHTPYRKPTRIRPAPLQPEHGIKVRIKLD